MTHTLPELFKYIIEHDSERPGMSQRVVPEVKDWRKRRNELTASAEKFISTSSWKWGKWLVISHTLKDEL